jgi:hypothetical protein
MLRWGISFAVNRLFLLALVMFVIKTYGPASCQAGAALTDWINHASPFDAINRALP